MRITVNPGEAPEEKPSQLGCLPRVAWPS
jgi:hypothetical protein